MDEDTIWSQLAFPSYLQSRETHKKGVCRDFDKAITAAERKQGADASMEEDLEEEDPAEAVWLSIRYSPQHCCLSCKSILMNQNLYIIRCMHRNSREHLVLSSACMCPLAA
jgi:hypothetical protein